MGLHAAVLHVHMYTPVGFHIPQHAATSAARGGSCLNSTRGGTLHHDEYDDHSTKQGVLRNWELKGKLNITPWTSTQKKKR